MPQNSCVPYIIGIVAFIGVVIVFLQCTVGVYIHNRKHKLWETRIVKTKVGLYQVQCWQHSSSDWYCQEQLNWYAIDNFGFNGKANYKSLKAAQRAKEKFDKKAYEWENCSNVVKVVEGANE